MVLIYILWRLSLDNVAADQQLASDSGYAFAAVSALVKSSSQCQLGRRISISHQM